MPETQAAVAGFQKWMISCSIQHRKKDIGMDGGGGLRNGERQKSRNLSLPP